MGSRKVKSRSKKKADIHKKKSFIRKCVAHKCAAQVSAADFAFNQVERTYSQNVLRESFPDSKEDELEMVRRSRISNKILMLTMKSKAQQQGFPVGGVPPPWSEALDSVKCTKEFDEKCFAKSKVPPKLVDNLTKELETCFDPSLHSIVAMLVIEMMFETVRMVECVTKEGVLAKLVEEFGLSPPRLEDDVLKGVVKKCVAAFQMLEDEAELLECFD